MEIPGVSQTAHQQGKRSILFHDICEELFKLETLNQEHAQKSVSWE